MPETCGELDKYGEWMCTREKGHEKNAAYRRAKEHWCFLGAVKYRWVGAQEAKPER